MTICSRKSDYTPWLLGPLNGNMLEQLACRAIVLDEAQNIKNYDTATAKAARRLQGEAKLALSGTPVENRLIEFCNPGMLGSKKLFSRRFEYPILSDSRGPAARRLRTMIRPFVRRRTKRQVLKDLPPKQEIEHLCVLGPAQKQRYDALAAIVRGIHCDPWWNPAVEEKIIQLKARKRELAEAVITDDAAALGGLSVEDVQLLLGDVSAMPFEENDEEEEPESAVQPDELLPPLPPTTQLAASILDKTTGEAQCHIVPLLGEGNHKGLPLHYITVCRGNPTCKALNLMALMPTLEYQRAKALLESFGIN